VENDDYIVVHIKSPAEYKNLMILLEEGGHRWSGGDMPTRILPAMRECVWIYHHERKLFHGDLDYAKQTQAKVISFDEYRGQINLNRNLIQAIRNVSRGMI
jgi:hypothetical protein